MFKVLFVDNDVVIRMVAKKAIEDHWGCKVLLAVSGAEALKVAAKEHPVLILLDVIMPAMDGVETLKRLREQGSTQPIIFVTAKEDVSDLLKFEAMGVVSVLKKPFVSRTLLEECSKVLDKKT